MKYRNIIIYPDTVGFDEISSSFVNSQTVWFFWHELQKANHRAVIQDAAWSSLARMFLKLCNKNKVDIINIVRYEEEAKELQEFGAKYALASESSDFKENLEILIKDLNPTGFYDWVGGKICSDIFFRMPKYSTLYIYGNLAGDEEIRITNRAMISSRKTITTINMTDFTDKFLSDEERQKYFTFVWEDISSGGEVFGTKIISTYSIEEFSKAVEESERIAGQGKVVIHPQK